MMDEEQEHNGQTREKVEKYMRMLNNKIKVGHALRRLASIDMTLEILSETGVGKVVNQMRSHEEFGPQASRIVEKWKDIARSCGLKQRRRGSHSSNSEHEMKPEKLKNERRRKKENNLGNETESNGSRICSSKSEPSAGRSGKTCSSLSFADMLARADTAKPFKPKKLKLDSNDWKPPNVHLHYKSSKVLNFEPTPKERHGTASEAATMDASMFKPRKSVRKIYAGRPKGDVTKEVSTLQNLCVKVLIANIDSIDEVGDTPYFLLKPVLEKCSVDQLSLIERRNPKLMEDSDELWERIVNRTFPKYETTDHETWRECYSRLCEENDRKLRMLSTKITQHSRETAVPVKTALLADAKAPREVRRRQMRYGTGHVNHVLPSASEISKARKEIFERGSKEALANLPYAVKNTNSVLETRLEKKNVAPKKGVLMMKTLKMLNVKRRK